MSLLDTALLQCEQFIRFRENDDLEEVNEHEMLDVDWNAFLQQYYSLCQYVTLINTTSSSNTRVCTIGILVGRIGLFMRSGASYL